MRPAGRGQDLAATMTSRSSAAKRAALCAARESAGKLFMPSMFEKANQMSHARRCRVALPMSLRLVRTGAGFRDFTLSAN